MEADGCKCRGVPEGMRRSCPPDALQSTPSLAAAASSISVSSSTASALIRFEWAISSDTGPSSSSTKRMWARAFSYVVGTSRKHGVRSRRCTKHQCAQWKSLQFGTRQCQNPCTEPNMLPTLSGLTMISASTPASSSLPSSSAVLQKGRYTELAVQEK